MKLIVKTVSFFVICLSCTVTADTNTVYSVPDAGELSAYDPPEVTVIQSGHGDAEIVLGWWGWPGAKGAPSALQKAARQAVADPDQSKYSFEYDAASWQFYDKYYPRTVDTIKKAVALGAWEVAGGTYSIQTTYQIGLESNVRQWVWGQKTLKEIINIDAKTFHFQEFMLFPQLPMFLKNVGIDQTLYQNHHPPLGRVHKDYCGVKWWEANDGSRVKAISDYPGLLVGWPDLKNLKSTPITLDSFIRNNVPVPTETFNPDESSFYFNAMDATDSYGNLTSINSYLLETEILTAERLATVVSIMSGADYSDQIRSAWNRLLTIQSHGIMYCPGNAFASAVGSSTFEGAKYHRDAGLKFASFVKNKCLKFISENIRTISDKPGSALVVFNPLGFRDTRIIKKALSFEPGQTRNIRILHGNKPIKFALTNTDRYPDGSLKKAEICFKAQEMPGIGYRVYNIEYCPNPPEINSSTGIVVNEPAGTVENQFVKIQFNKNGDIGAVYSKSQNRIILGTDARTEPATQWRSDRTVAIRLRDTWEQTALSQVHGYQPRGWEVVQSNAMKVIVKARFESPMSHVSIYLTLYDNLPAMDITVEHVSKNPQGDMLVNSSGEQQERVWLDFIPAFRGDSKCNTIADVLRQKRNYYFSNTWINYSNTETAFTIMHKGIHAWQEGHCHLRITRKSDFALSAQLGQTINGLITGLARFNTKYADDGVLRQEFSLLVENITDEYQIEKAAQRFHFDMPMTVTAQHDGLSAEKEFINIKSDNAIVSAFYADITTDKKPALRLFNPSQKEVEVELSAGFDYGKIQDTRFDGVNKNNPYNMPGKIPIAGTGLSTVKFSETDMDRKGKRQEGVTFSSIPYIEKGKGNYYFDAPLESYRFVHQYALYRDSDDYVYTYTDPYDEMEVDFSEGSREGDYRIFNGQVHVPLSCQNKQIRLIATWKTSKKWGINISALTDNYSQRADEPVTVVVNGKTLPHYNYDLTNYVDFGANNKIRLEVLAPNVPDSVLQKRPSLFGSLDAIEKFGDLDKGKLRIGKVINQENYKSLSDCSIMNPDFENGDLNGWQSSGPVKVTDNDGGKGPNRYVHITKNGSMEQKIAIQPGNYIFKVKVKANDAKCLIGVTNSSGFEVSNLIADAGVWENHSVRFTVPKGVHDAKIFVRHAEGKGHVQLDDFVVFANKVAKNF